MSSVRIVAAACVVVGALGLTGCAADRAADPPTSTPIQLTTGASSAAAAVTASAGGVYAPMDTGRSQSGLEGLILSVEDTVTRYGPATVVTFQVINTTSAVWDGFNWPTPTVVYGAAGVQAEHVISLSEGYGTGVQGSIPPGSRQTVKHAYKVSKAALNPAVITAGSVLWQGDFSTFQR
ncbi:hypothetical protein NDR87_31505 [Nocardia sp. CDC159]|uniref:DUF4352 domain-containing protein n=1 Tax=Nocardia pulmonis TaxID=2951408 RepID=A0A9X2IZZ0_9NOCA|nr:MULTISPECIES: hypothetical protein [Nocardia]MCM6777923.1 hypothetical protein [Nocardia pulmonis]MCM6790906.1 hypothetical protein [Nocardia sp. CDC159]